MSRAITRRQMLITTGAATAGVMLGSVRPAAAAPKATIGDITVITKEPELYHGWPTVARCKSGRLLVTCSGGREEHVCPFGRVDMIQSDDDGQTWSAARTLMDTKIDDRDSGVIETAGGSILVTTFTSLAYVPGLEKAEKIELGQPGAWPKDRLKRWQEAHNRLTADERKAQLGVWMLRSTDGGKTFSEPYRCLANSPHGPIQLSDGRVLYAGKNLWADEPPKVGVCESADDGQTWKWLAVMPTREGDDPKNYHELHAVEASDGTIVAQIRNHNKANARETLQTESSDGGKTWSVPHSIGVWGLPSHLVRLNDDRLLMSYGHRRKPFGNQARVSEDHGRTWSEPVIVSGDGPGGDLGYPSTVQLGDGSLLTVWYERMAASPRAVLRQARWTLES